MRNHGHGIENHKYTEPVVQLHTCGRTGKPIREGESSRLAAGFVFLNK